MDFLAKSTTYLKIMQSFLRPTPTFLQNIPQNLYDLFPKKITFFSVLFYFFFFYFVAYVLMNAYFYMNNMKYEIDCKKKGNCMKITKTVDKEESTPSPDKPIQNI
jgi:hypothetical protein